MDCGRRPPADEDRRGCGGRSRRTVERGDRPFLVVGTAALGGAGAVDPLPEIGAICREHGLWFHVDGAYGAFAAAVPGAPADLAGLAEADSVAVDPHKWLYAPIEAGCALVKRPEDLRNAFSYHPPYYRFGEEVLNFVDYGPQNSRGFRALESVAGAAADRPRGLSWNRLPKTCGCRESCSTCCRRIPSSRR